MEVSHWDSISVEEQRRMSRGWPFEAIGSVALGQISDEPKPGVSYAGEVPPAPADVTPPNVVRLGTFTVEKSDPTPPAAA